MQIDEARQLTQLARDEPCQLIGGYKTVEEINGKTDANTIILSNSELDTGADLQRDKTTRLVN